MNNSLQKIYSKISEYSNEFFKKKHKNFNTNRCPICQFKANCLTVQGYKIICLNSGCNFKGNIIDLVRIAEPNKYKWSDEDILSYLSTKYNTPIIFENEIENLINMYSDYGFDLTPLLREKKIPFEKNWSQISHKNPSDWKEWIKEGLNIGVKTGKVSNITIIDIDNKETYNKVKNMLGNTLIQKTGEGRFQAFYLYDSDLPNKPTQQKAELLLDILNDGSQSVIPPSSVVYENKESGETVEIIKRYFVNKNPIIEIPKELKELILSKIEKKKTIEVNQEELFKNVLNDNITLDSISEGNRNNLLIHMGGVFRKHLNMKDTSFVLNIINSKLVNPPLNSRELNNLVSMLDKYIGADDVEVANKVLEYLRIVEEATVTELKDGLNIPRVKIDSALKNLIRDNYVIKKRKNYHLIKRVEWKDSFFSETSKIDFNMPYFNDVSEFRYGDMLVIGAKQKVGKTHIAMNIIKRLVEQNIKPYYVNLESSNRFATIARSLGLREGSFYYTTHFAPEQIEIEENAVTIIDWLLPKDYSETDKLFQHFATQLVKNKGLLIIFVQLKDNGDYFAKNMVGMFPAFVCKYFYNKTKDNTEDPTSGYFQVEYMREAKVMRKHARINCKYDWDTKELVTLTTSDDRSREEF